MEAWDEWPAEHIYRAMSRERLAPYLAACRGDLAAAMRLYGWNLEVAAAFFHGPLHYLEITLRNALDRELAARFGRRDWWFAPDVDLHDYAAGKVAKAREKLSRRSKDPTSGAMVAELPFGFWVSLLGKGNDYEMRFWRPALRRAFPRYRGRRVPLHRDLDHVREFRNRIAHHEPIYGRHLVADHATVLRLLGYISPEARDCLKRYDLVPEVLARRPDVPG